MEDAKMSAPEQEASQPQTNNITLSNPDNPPAEPEPENLKLRLERRSGRSPLMFVLQKLVRPFNTQLVKPRKTYPAGSPQLDPHKSTKKACDITERKVEDIYVYDIVAKKPASGTGTGAATGQQKDISSRTSSNDTLEASKNKSAAPVRKRIYYFAGGGWRAPPSSEHWSLVNYLASNLANTTITVVSYPLAPNSPAPIAFPQLMALYNTLLTESAERNETAILAGDSAGGNIALCLPLHALALNPKTAPVPAAIMAISPSADLRRHNPEIKNVQKHDPILTIPFINDTANGWRGEWDPYDKRISPLAADLTPLVDRGVAVHGVVGTYDILSPDAILFRMECEKAGVKGEWLEWAKQMHVWVLAFKFGLRESKEGVEWIADVLRRV